MSKTGANDRVHCCAKAGLSRMGRCKGGGGADEADSFNWWGPEVLGDLPPSPHRPLKDNFPFTLRSSKQMERR
ncbi:hypothetical protein J6590_012909 [Homalodisca vitripennis]|nr:hypothetical protein J6590_012909 [Homalodisca vitripennis]